MVKVRQDLLFGGPCVNGIANRQAATPRTATDNNSEMPVETDDAYQRHIALERIQENTQKIRSHLVDHATGVTDMLQELLQNVDGYLQLNESQVRLNGPNHTSDSKSQLHSPDKFKDELPDKVFQVRQSLLTELFQISHIQSIYHIFVAGLVLLFLQSALYDVLETGWIRLNFGMILYAFGQMQTVVIVWLLMKSSVIFVFFPGFHFWANNRLSWPKNTDTIDRVFQLCFIAFISLFMYLPVKIILTENVPPASSAILMCEQVRLAMKTYAFFRSNWTRARHFKPHQDGDDRSDSPCPDFGKFLYFLFAPTLIYRDEYPRTKDIQWGFVASNLIQVFACLIYTYYLFERFCVPVFQRFGKEPFGFRSLLLSVFGCMLPGTLVLLIQFYSVLHCWMNAFAEMLRFGDRLFYEDWWNSKSYSNYYRTWNIVVHDWLYTYVYKDVYQIFKPDRGIPMLIVFMLSAVVHEYMVSLMFHFFYPILFFFFGGIGTLFLFLTKSKKSRFWNIFFWLTYFAGPGMLMTLYCLEIYARQNCQPVMDCFLDFFIPRSWFCS